MPENQTQKPIIGILGAIGSGKSSVAKEFGKLGCAVINADELAHKQLKNDDIKQQIRQNFTDQAFDDQGNVDRARLAELAFEDQQNLEKLNSIIHPPVIAEVKKRIKHYSSNSDIKAIVLDLPLLMEVSWEKKCDFLVFVEVSEQLRASRMAQKSIFLQKNAKKREKFQISLDKKRQIAHYIINNNSDFRELSRQVHKIFSRIIDSYK